MNIGMRSYLIAASPVNYPYENTRTGKDSQMKKKKKNRKRALLETTGPPTPPRPPAATFTPPPPPKPVCFTITQRPCCNNFIHPHTPWPAQRFTLRKAHSNLIHRQPPTPERKSQPGIRINVCPGSASGGKLECGPLVRLRCIKKAIVFAGGKLICYLQYCTSSG